MKLGACTEWLFFHLWKKNPNSGQSCNGVFLADTVIYRWAQPYFRYFTAPNGQIIRKTKERVFIEQVETAFQQENTVALLLTSTSQDKTCEQINFEYFDKETFSQFLYQREKELNQILQKFIYPKNDQNLMIKVTWSPQFCLIHRKTNKNSMKEVRKPLFERVCTFEGPEYLSSSDSISSPILSSDLEQLCVNIVKHVQEVSGGNIQIIRMVLYFKVDTENRIWLLFCTGIKVKDKFNTEQTSERVDSPIFRVIRRDLEPVQLRNEQVQKLVKYNNDGQVEQLLYQTKNVCSNCDLWSQDLYGLQFEFIIESFERKLVTNECTRLPEELQKIKMKNEVKSHNKIRIQQQHTKKDYQMQNIFEQRSANSSQQQEILVEKYQVINNFKTYDQIHSEIQALCRHLDEEQEDQKLNFKTVPALLLKVWGKISEEKYFNLRNNPSWRNLSTQVCQECYLTYTECCNLTKFERRINTQAKQLRKKVEEIQTEKVFSAQLMNNNTKSQQSFPQIQPILNQEVKLVKPTPIRPITQQQRSTAQNTPPVQDTIQFKKTTTKDNEKTTKLPSTQKIYQHKQGLKMSVNNSVHSHSSKSTLDQSKISFDYMLNTVWQLKKKLQELEEEESQQKPNELLKKEKSELSNNLSENENDGQPHQQFKSDHIKEDSQIIEKQEQ